MLFFKDGEQINGISGDGMNIAPSTGDDYVANRDSANYSRACGFFRALLGKTRLAPLSTKFCLGLGVRERDNDLTLLSGEHS